MRTLSIALLMVVSAVLPAHASADGETMQSLNLLGRWAFDCAEPSGDDNAHILYEVPANGIPTEHIMMGSGLDRVSTIAAVEKLADGKVQWVQDDNDGGPKLTIVNVVEPSRLKTWRSVTATGEVFIRDGRFAGGGEAPWFYRCEARQ